MGGWVMCWYCFAARQGWCVFVNVRWCACETSREVLPESCPRACASSVETARGNEAQQQQQQQQTTHQRSIQQQQRSLIAHDGVFVIGELPLSREAAEDVAVHRAELP